MNLIFEFTKSQQRKIKNLLSENEQQKDKKKKKYKQRRDRKRIKKNKFKKFETRSSKDQRKAKDLFFKNLRNLKLKEKD